MEMGDVVWLCLVHECAADGERKPPPVPAEAMAERIRDDGELAEFPALALLDEIIALRAERDALLAKVRELEARPMVVTDGVGFTVGEGGRVHIARQTVTGGVGFKL